MLVVVVVVVVVGYSMTNENEYNDYNCEAIERNYKEREIGETSCGISR